MYQVSSIPTLLLSGAHSIQTRDNSQEISHGMMTITNKFWVGGRGVNMALTSLDNDDHPLQKG